MAPPPPGAAEQLAFLRAQLARGHDARDCKLIETHVSWVLLGAEHVYKVKKAVCSTLFDFSTPAARERNAHEETRLNRRLAPGVYLGVLSLQWDGRQLSLVPEGQRDPHIPTIDSIVWMTRLPQDAMLDALMANERLTPQHIDALLHVMLAFYRKAERAPCGGTAYLSHLRCEQAINREVLCRPRFSLHIARPVLDGLDDAIAAHEDALRGRALRLVEGHGDLRPEHVCLLDPPVVIDALEFNARLRRIDPFDELAFLGLECAMGGAPWVGPQLAAGARRKLADELPSPLWPLYTALRAALRARLCAAHLLDEEPRTPARWLPLASRYIAQAAHALAGLHAA